jgi:hypothetical protein
MFANLSHNIESNADYHYCQLSRPVLLANPDIGDNATPNTNAVLSTMSGFSAIWAVHSGISITQCSSKIDY